MKIVILLMLVLFSFSSCSSDGNIVLKKDQIWVVSKHEKPVFSFKNPERGTWRLSSAAENTSKYGSVEVNGWLPNGFNGYVINFKFNDADNFNSTYLEDIPAIKNKNYKGLLKKRLEWFTPERMKEQRRINLGGKLILFNEFTCLNTWHEQTIAPNLNGGKGFQSYQSSIYCPFVVDGVPKSFFIGIRSGINPTFYEQKAEYDRTKRQEDPEINIDTKELLTTLGDKVLSIFSDIKIYGNVSQNYDDIINKCDPTQGQQCGIYP